MLVQLVMLMFWLVVLLVVLLLVLLVRRLMVSGAGSAAGRGVGLRPSVDAASPAADILFRFDGGTQTSLKKWLWMLLLLMLCAWMNLVLVVLLR